MGAWMSSRRPSTSSNRFSQCHSSRCSTSLRRLHSPRSALRRLTSGACSSRSMGHTSCATHRARSEWRRRLASAEPWPAWERPPCPGGWSTSLIHAQPSPGGGPTSLSHTPFSSSRAGIACGAGTAVGCEGGVGFPTSGPGVAVNGRVRHVERAGRFC